MDDVTSSSQLRIALSLSVALLFHTLVGIFLAKWIPHEPVVTIDNISVTLKQPDSVASTNNSGGASAQRSETQSSGGTRDVVTTTDSSQLITAPSEPRTIQPEIAVPATANESRPTTSSSNSTPNAPEIPIKRPQFTTIGNRPAPSSSQGGDFNQFSQLFAQRDDLTPLQAQISTTTGDTMDPYLLLLVQKLSQSQFHDGQFKYSTLTISRSLVVEVKLLPSGALENARIMKSSGDEKLDKAALRAAFLASPYPPPPIEDMHKAYTYQITLNYSPPNQETK
jgi:protein TonB